MVFDHPEGFETKKSKFPDTDGSVDVLTCRYCAVEIDVLTRKILGLINETRFWSFFCWEGI